MEVLAGVRRQGKTSLDLLLERPRLRDDLLGRLPMGQDLKIWADALFVAVSSELGDLRKNVDAPGRKAHDAIYLVELLRVFIDLVLQHP